MYEKERLELVNKLKQKGIKDEAVLKAFTDVERHKFVWDAMLDKAYLDIALPIGYEQTISQPYTVAIMTECLKLNKGNKVLEIGTGSGYQAAILYKMGMNVYSIERHFDLFQKTRKLFDDLGIRAYLKCGDGTIGWKEFAPYDGIIVTAGSKEVPKSLKNQLAIGGTLVIPIGDRVSQTMKVITKTDEDSFKEENIPEFTFVPLIGREGWNERY
ncbi:MAG TPA: protein-L-isoaspartate(D-aspartate) O-methyltransferase [Ignavibacteriaceae bacterium]|nr:protein-L-isoaspartate(D-aspartate) O-methyltransferase [Ignavibacteriaceae bacterium]